MLLFWPQTLYAAADLAKAQSLLLRGRYEEAEEIFRPEAAASPQAALGLAACLEAQGKSEKAIEALRPHAAKQAVVQAELARLAFERGDLPEARSRAAEALRLSNEQPLARYISGELARTSGQLAEAEKHYRRLIDFYNLHEVKKPESLRWIGRGAAEYARWNRMNDQFDLLVNEIYPAARKLNPQYWPVHYEAGLLFLEKHNQADAAKEFQAALEINPRAAEVHAAMARLALEGFGVKQAEASLRRALEINPRLLVALQLKADLTFFHGLTADALKLLEEKALPLNPLAESTLGRIAACYLLIDSSDAPESRFQKLVGEVLKRNPRAGEFYSDLAGMLHVRHKYAEAEHYLLEAIRIMPQQVGPRADLGLLYMHAGREPEARRQLQQAFEADPFHVRVKNSLDVLDVIGSMETLTSEHFVVKYDKPDARLAGCVSRRLEAFHAELKALFGYEPPQPTIVEIFRSARGQSGHAWFSARMIGLPYLGTIGASTGRIIALASPGETDIHRTYNWGRVLKHELVHVFNLQQTRYNMPHWLAEGLAVHSEHGPRPHRWHLLLRKRAAEGRLMNLDTINMGFAQPVEGDDCHLAYCQGELYVEYMLSLGKADCLNRLLAAYTADPSTPKCMEKVFGMSQAEFERGYTAFVRKLLDSTPVLDRPDEEPFEELQAAHRREPHSAAISARLAYASLQRGAKSEAEALAREALKLEPRQQLATYVLVRLGKAGLQDEAMGKLEACLDRKAPDPVCLNFVAAWRLKNHRYDEAAELYALAEHRDPTNPQWPAALARTYLAAGKTFPLAQALARFARAEVDDLPSRKKLAELAMARRDAAEARRWASEALEIDVEDAAAHRLLAAALVELAELPAGIEEYEAAIELEPAHLQQRLALADALVQAGRRAKAQEVLTELLRRDPNFPGAEVLLESLKKKP